MAVGVGPVGPVSPDQYFSQTQSFFFKHRSFLPDSEIHITQAAIMMFYYSLVYLYIPELGDF